MSPRRAAPLGLLVLLAWAATGPGPFPGRVRERSELVLRPVPVARERSNPRSRAARLRRALEEAEDASARGDRVALASARLAAAACHRADESWDLARAYLAPVLTDGPPDLAARARLELAHVARRAGDVEEARRRYSTSAWDGDLARRERDRAIGAWAALEQRAGDLDLAERLWVVLAGVASRPVDRVRAWERVVSARARRGHLLGARCIALGCLELFSDLAATRTEDGDGLRRALARLLDHRR